MTPVDCLDPAEADAPLLLIPVLRGTSAPNAGSGTVAGIGTFYCRTVGEFSELWYKNGPTEFDWERITVAI